MTIAEFFIIRPQGPNCWIGLGALRDRVLLEQNTNSEQTKHLVSNTAIKFDMKISPQLYY